MDHLIDDNDRLKPCPFCGGEVTFDHDDNGWNWVECLACGASTNARVSAMDDCKQLLLEQWNKRVPGAQPAPRAPDGVAEALQRLIENGAVLGPASSEDALLVARYRQRLLSSAPSVPEGWRLVPIEPTPMMKTAGIGVEVYQDSPPSSDCLTWKEVEAIYTAMLAKAPEAKP